MRKNNKTVEVRKELDRLLKISEDRNEPLVISRCEFAKSLGCTPHLVSYVLNQINKNNEYSIISKRGSNGGIRIEKLKTKRGVLIGQPVKGTLSPAVSRMITREREKQIELCLRSTIDHYLAEYVDCLDKEYVYNPKRIHEMIRDICYIMLRQNVTENDDNIIFLIESAIEYSLNVNTKLEADPIVTKEEEIEYTKRQEEKADQENREFKRKMLKKKEQLEKEKEEKAKHKKAIKH